MLFGGTGNMSLDSAINQHRYRLVWLEQFDCAREGSIPSPLTQLSRNGLERLAFVT